MELVKVGGMRESTFTFAAQDGTAISVYCWLPEVRPPEVHPKAAQPKAAVQIVHGLAEHAGRYRRVAEALTAEGYAVYASDLRGHGRTACNADDLGFLAERDGWRKCLDDLWQLNGRISAETRVPIMLLGHSMGSTLARQLVAEHGDALAGVVLSGSSGQPVPLAIAGRMIARAERLRLGARGRSPLIRALTFDTFNARFRPARTRFDWLSRDAAEVDKYAADALCGFTPSTQLWIDFLDAWAKIAGSCAGLPKNLPLYVTSGSDDPVSERTKMLQPMLAQYRAAGLSVEHKFYPQARHELLNETNREEVTQDLIAWMRRVVARQSAAGRR